VPPRPSTSPAVLKQVQLPGNTPNVSAGHSQHQADTVGVCTRGELVEEAVWEAGARRTAPRLDRDACHAKFS